MTQVSEAPGASEVSEAVVDDVKAYFDWDALISDRPIALDDGPVVLDGRWSSPHWLEQIEDLDIGDDGKSPFMANNFTIEHLRHVTNLRAGSLQSSLGFVYEVVHLSVQHVVHTLMTGGTQVTGWNELPFQKRQEIAKKAWGTCRAIYKDTNKQKFIDYHAANGSHICANTDVYTFCAQSIDAAMYWQMQDLSAELCSIPATPVATNKHTRRAQKAVEEEAHSELLREAVQSILDQMSDFRQEVDELDLDEPVMQVFSKYISSITESAEDVLAATPSSAVELRNQLWAVAKSGTQVDTGSLEIHKLKGDNHCAFHGFQCLYDNKYDQEGKGAPALIKERRSLIAGLALSTTDIEFTEKYDASKIAQRCLSSSAWAGEAEAHLVGVELGITVNISLLYAESAVVLGAVNKGFASYMVYTGGHYNIVRLVRAGISQYVFDKKDTDMIRRITDLIHRVREDEGKSSPAYAQLQAFNKDSRARVARQVAAAKASKAVGKGKRVTFDLSGDVDDSDEDPEEMEPEWFLHGFPGKVDKIKSKLVRAGIATHGIAFLGKPPSGSRGLGARKIRFKNAPAAKLFIAEVRSCYPSHAVRINKRGPGAAQGGKRQGTMKRRRNKNGKPANQSQTEVTQPMQVMMDHIRKLTDQVAGLVGGQGATDPNTRIAQIRYGVKECRYAIQGKPCPFEPNCRFAHPTGGARHDPQVAFPRHLHQQQQHHRQDYASVVRATLPRQHLNHQMSMSQQPAVPFVLAGQVPRLPVASQVGVCFQYQRTGQCRYGNTCKYSHSKEQCRDWTNGRCTRAHCKFAHR